MRTKLAILAAVIAILVQAPRPRAAITFFGETVIPTDGAAATNATTTITLTPPASMTKNDLVVVNCTQRGTATFSVGVTGGQRWASLGRATTTNIAHESWWATFDGNWAANPRFDFSAGTNTTCFGLVVRPNSSASVWALRNNTTGTFTAAATITITGVTLPSSGNAVAIALWHTADDNTWGTLTGSGWSKTGLTAQYRNTASTDASSTTAYFIGTGATGNVSQTQLTLGNDAGATRIIGFEEVRRRDIVGNE